MQRPGGAVRRIVAAILGVAALAAAEWTYRPTVAYDDETVRCVWSGSAADWRIEQPGDVRVSGDGNGLAIDWVPGRDQSLRLRGVDAIVDLVAVPPGSKRDLALGEGRLISGTAGVILVLSRIEARSDRRWALIRALGDDTPKPCAQALLWPEDVPAGTSPLLRQCVQARTLTPDADGVLVEIHPGEGRIGWKHREFRQTLAWLVADLQVRGAGAITLVQPRDIPQRDAALVPLREQVVDVANAYRCRVLDPVGLADEACWRISPGLVGETLNEHGRAIRAGLHASWIR